MSKPQRTTSEPLTQAEMRQALDSSGYPLEMRLLKSFAQGGMDPIIGFRVATGRETREIDIIAALHKSFPLSDGKLLSVTLRLVIEAKSMERRAAFVGFPWTRPTEHELRVNRVFFGGYPSNRIVATLPRDSMEVIGPGGLAESFDAMNKVPHCVQWSVIRAARSSGEERLIAGHDFWEGIDTSVRAAGSLMLESSICNTAPMHVRLIFVQPVLVVATPQLWLFDAAKPGDDTNLDPTDRLVLARMFEVGDSVQHRLVDVVAEPGVPRFIAACKETFDELASRALRHGLALDAIAHAQRQQLAEELLQRVP